MDYNDIKSRLERTLVSLKARFDENIDDHTHYEFYERDGELRVSMTFGTEDEKVLVNPIMTILYNLASLKDHLKNGLKEQRLNPQIVEDEINGSLHLQVLMDIVNQDKHGSPLKINRSKRNPVIMKPSQSFRMASALRDDEGNALPGEGPPAMIIDAYIRDGKGELLFYLNELVETSYSKFVALAKNNGIAVK